MRPYALLMSCLLLVLGTGNSRAQGIQFSDISWKEALSRAARSGKPIFLDAYTSWCGPCKLLTKNVFTQEATGAFFNQHFINLKVDMEKGEGIDLASRYGIDVFPTLIFFDSSGNIVHRAAGYHNREELIALGQTALDPTNNFAGLVKRYNSGERTPGLLLALGKIKANAYDPGAAALINAYLKAQGDLGTAENMEVIFRYVDDPYSDAFRFLVNNQSKFETIYGEKATREKIEGVFENYLSLHPELQLGEVQRLYGVCYPGRGEALASAYRMTYYRQRSDMENFARAAVDHYQKYPSEDSDELNEMAWLFWQNVQAPEMLEQAIRWAQKSIELQESWYNHDTLARIYQKTGKKKQALKYAQKALEIAEKTGEDATQTRELIKNLEGG